MSGNPLATLLSQQKVKPAWQKCSCATCQNRPNLGENYGWVSTINENYQREVKAKMEEEKDLALARRRAMIKMKKATKMNISTCTTNVTTSSSTNMMPTNGMCTNTAMNITTTATSITTMTSSLRTPTTTICIPITRPPVPSATKISERGLGSLPTANSTTTISTRTGTACTTTTSNSTNTSTSLTTIGSVVQWQVPHCPYMVLSYLDQMIITSANNSTNPRFQSGPPCGNDARQEYEATREKKA